MIAQSTTQGKPHTASFPPAPASPALSALDACLARLERAAGVALSRAEGMHPWHVAHHARIAECYRNEIARTRRLHALIAEVEAGTGLVHERHPAVRVAQYRCRQLTWWLPESKQERSA